MQHTHVPSRTRLTLAVAAITLVAAACGSETTLSSSGTTTDTAPVVTAEAPSPATAPTTAPTTEPTTAPSSVPTAPAAPVADEESDTTTPTTQVDPPEATADEAVSEPADEPVEPPEPGSDDLAVEPVDPPEPEPIDDLASPDDDLTCGLPPMPDDATIGNELWVDLDGVGGDNDRVVSYFDGTWKLRVEFSTGAQSEIEVPGAGVHGVRAIGFADVDLTYGGDELLAVVGGGAYTVEIGVFTFLEGGCITRYQAEGGGDFSVYSGASVMHGAGVVCGDGYITSWGFERDDDDTYTVWDASFEPVSIGVFGYMPASDGYAEGLSHDDLSDTLFDCNGLSL